MSIDTLRDALLWCAVINYGVLLIWFLFFILARDFMHRLHGRWFRLSGEQFDLVHYSGMAIFKLGIILFNLVSYVALRIVG
jgi:phosphatidylglycerophosphate synthase